MYEFKEFCHLKNFSRKGEIPLLPCLDKAVAMQILNKNGITFRRVFARIGVPLFGPFTQNLHRVVLF